MSCWVVRMILFERISQLDNNTKEHRALKITTRPMIEIGKKKTRLWPTNWVQSNNNVGKIKRWQLRSFMSLFIGIWDSRALYMSRSLWNDLRTIRDYLNWIPYGWNIFDKIWVACANRTFRRKPAPKLWTLVWLCFGSGLVCWTRLGNK